MPPTTKYGQFEKVFANQRGMLTTGEEHSSLDVIYKFGHNDAVTTVYSVVAEDGIYRTPTPANATTLRIKAGDVVDTASGAGARLIQLFGINELGEQITEFIPTAGASAGSSTTQLFMRLWRARVVDTGVYPTDMLMAGHAADIVIENTAGTEEWALIKINSIADAQTQIGAFSIGRGQRGFLSQLALFVESIKAVDFSLVMRPNFMDVTAPIQPVRIIATATGIVGAHQIPLTEPPEFPEFTDVALLAKVAATEADCSVQLNIILNSAGFNT